MGPYGPQPGQGPNPDRAPTRIGPSNSRASPGEASSATGAAHGKVQDASVAHTAISLLSSPTEASYAQRANKAAALRSNSRERGIHIGST